MRRGNTPITREQAIEFCRERKQMHLNGAEHWRNIFEMSQKDVDKIKGEAQKDLARIYGDIAEMLEAIETDS